MYSFPGRRVGGTAAILGPLLLLTGTLLRSPFPFFYPHQLDAMADHPALMSAAYTTFLAGHLVTAFGVLALVARIGRTRPALATWSGVLVVVGLVERTFHGGVDHAAQGLVRRHGPEFAARLVGESYQDPHLYGYLSLSIMLGWPVLAFAAWRSGELGVLRAVALAAMTLLPLGVLKGAEVVSIVGTVGLCVALLPAGVRSLREGAKPSRRAVLGTIALLPLVGALGYVSTLG
ncbi:hypothetical protein ABZ816_31780 [Actinosynnema sp. NPDC047251]|uniref:Putative secreted protein n=1 Tax=Saccharothrix espanaensis (strain ATCC 51144 / DSM 44229 / JCM 9112 / NBRC 15066 / NRRL 15764) TaxID=1179773 RepID=K0JZF6_SACES|nr:hypothetical protein [Saccharothrix espanaensis]CCH30039.1 putative secreted protein [Saccharothrix espanaensis DSM 44229]